ncbi:MAG TPA: ABC transporter permease subunit [Acidimicrobiales bacterium]|jgi:hypothetical protein|nr:ABC transporter permease subunit [Acidimicrobiales bacterium]
MMWVVWRQQRSIVAAFFLAAVVFTVWMLITGLHEQSLWHQYLSAPCKGGFGITKGDANFCGRLQSSVYGSGVQRNDVVTIIGTVFAPLFGLVLGVNAVAREIEQKTNRLAWTQSESRSWWLVSKYLTSIASMAIILVPLCFVLSWWVGASHDGARISTKAFPVSGFVEIAYGIFSFVLAVVIGLLLRRAGWSLAVGIILFAALFLTFGAQLRPNLVTPNVMTLHSVQQVTKGSVSGFYSTGGAPATSWFLSQGYEPKLTKGVPSRAVMNSSTSEIYRCETRYHQEPYCAQRLGLRSIELYIPDSRFWTLQFLEAGFYLVLAAMLAVFSLFGIRRSRA